MKSSAINEERKSKMQGSSLILNLPLCGSCRAAMREFVRSTPTGLPSTKSLKITEEKVLPSQFHMQMVTLSSLFG